MSLSRDSGDFTAALLCHREHRRTRRHAIDEVGPSRHRVLKGRVAFKALIGFGSIGPRVLDRQKENPVLIGKVPPTNLPTHGTPEEQSGMSAR